MARRRRESEGGASGKAQYDALENRLVLLAWLNSQFGYEYNHKMLADLEESVEVHDDEDRSPVYYRLRSRGNRVNVSPNVLDCYDNNIRTHLRSMNARRSRPIVLRYFQYAAALYTELFLDWYFHRRGEFVRQLNHFTVKRNMDTRFSEADIDKLAFWMATGSGKTLIMHLNYRQFLHYNDRSGRPLDNVLLITPNEGMSDQHISEMEESGIACRRFDFAASGLAFDKRDVVQVIEITKLKLEETKRGSGVSVPVEAFEGNNLIFVDEGHKGLGGEAWRKFRDALGRESFTFEYSATFGQALTAARNDPLTEEYGKAIVFDYSYCYFHDDGYGKDFRILNLQEETTKDGTWMLLLGNLLSFYEQRRVFEEQTETMKPYNLERPLQLFVGGTVNAVYTENRRKRSDVLDVARFLHDVLTDRDGRVVADIQKLLEGNTGLFTPDDRDVFEGRFPYLRASGMSAGQIYIDILKRVLHAPAKGGLHLWTIRSRPDEIGLKASGADDYFGLIYIGDVSKFKNLVERDDSEIELKEDVISDSLFERVGAPDTTIDMLIGAKKFMEGWNSWRVSNMGLLNVGRSEGSEIIQLFGRGVRLRGRDFGLKRSAKLGGEHPKHVNLLETLNVFAVRANYMARFRDYLEREGVEPDGNIELTLPIKQKEEFLGRGLLLPRVPKDRDFAEEENLLLEPDGKIQVSVDMTNRVQELSGDKPGASGATVRARRARPIPQQSLDLIDWQEVYLELVEYKESKGLSNLAIRPETAREIMELREPPLYRLISDESVTKPGSFKDTARLHGVVVSILRKYMDRLHSARERTWETKNMNYDLLSQKHANFKDYIVKISRKEEKLIEDIRNLIEQADDIYKPEIEYMEALPSIHFDRHLYQPLLIEERMGRARDEGKVKSDPPGLKESERRFVADLKKYCRAEKKKSLAGKDLYLLRNLERGKGVGFFETRGFYPDFILWIMSSDEQRIVFVEPHGMRYAGPYRSDDKANLHERLKELAEAIEERVSVEERTWKGNVVLDSFIVSETSYEDLQPIYDGGKWNLERFKKEQILFPGRDEYDYLAILMGLDDDHDQ